MLERGDMAKILAKLDSNKTPTKKELIDAYYLLANTAIGIQHCEYSSYNTVLIDICVKLKRIEELIISKGGEITPSEINYKEIALLA